MPNPSSIARRSGCDVSNCLAESKKLNASSYFFIARARLSARGETNTAESDRDSSSAFRTACFLEAEPSNDSCEGGEPPRRSRKKPISRFLFATWFCRKYGGWAIVICGEANASSAWRFLVHYSCSDVYDSILLGHCSAIRFTLLSPLKIEQ